MITNLTIAVWNGWEIYDLRRLIANRRLSQILRTALVRKKMQKSKIIAKITLIIRADTRDTKRASECHWIQIWVILGNRQKQLRFGRDLSNLFLTNFKSEFFENSSFKWEAKLSNFSKWNKHLFAWKNISAKMLDGAPARRPFLQILFVARSCCGRRRVIRFHKKIPLGTIPFFATKVASLALQKGKKVCEKLSRVTFPVII